MEQEVRLFGWTYRRVLFTDQNRRIPPCDSLRLLSSVAGYQFVSFRLAVSLLFPHCVLC